LLLFTCLSVTPSSVTLHTHLTANGSERARWALDNTNTDRVWHGCIRIRDELPLRWCPFAILYRTGTAWTLHRTTSCCSNPVCVFVSLRLVTIWPGEADRVGRSMPWKVKRCSRTCLTGCGGERRGLIRLLKTDSGRKRLQLGDWQLVKLLAETKPQQECLVCVHLEPIAAHPFINSFYERDETLYCGWCGCLGSADVQLRVVSIWVCSKIYTGYHDKQLSMCTTGTTTGREWSLIARRTPATW